MIMTTIHGGCHCGRVRYRATVTPPLRVQRCNCSLCTPLAYLHLIVPARNFSLLSGADDLSDYRFNTGVARHLFCRHCGVKSFYVPRSNPDGYSLNLRCIEERDRLEIDIEDFDGQHWEQHAAALHGLSQ